MATHIHSVSIHRGPPTCQARGIQWLARWTEFLLSWNLQTIAVVLWDPFRKVWEVKMIFIIKLKHDLLFLFFLCVDMCTDNTKTTVGTTDGTLIHIRAGDQAVGIVTVFTPIGHFQLKKNSNYFTYECSWWSSKTYWFDETSPLEMNIFFRVCVTQWKYT